MKVWVNNRVDQEREVDDTELVREFLNSKVRKDTMGHWPIERQVSVFLMDKNYTYEMLDFERLVERVIKEL